MLAEWGAIAPPRDSATINVLRADPAHPLDFRIGRDARGRFTFQLDAAGWSPEGGGADPPAGMDVLLDDIGEGTTRLTLLLFDREDFEIFRVLCGDLLDVTRGFSAGEAPRAMRLLLGRLGQWQEVLARRRRGRLSPNEEMGLFGELVFLRDALAPRVGVAAAVAAWRGPYGDEQDFAVAGAIVEVKTQGTTMDGRIMVSSEGQLDTSSCTIFVCRQCVHTKPGDSGGESLDSVAAALLHATAHLPAANARLQTGLEAAGWIAGAGYDETWELEHRVFYRVGEGFPRIVRADLRPGVERVRYQILVADCLPFSVGEDEVFGGAAA